MNESLNGTLELTKNLTYENIVSLTHEIPFIIGGLIVWLFPLFVYILIAINTKPRSSSRTYEGNMLSTLNGWIPIIIFGFLTGGLLLLLFYFPVWTS